MQKVQSTIGTYWRRVKLRSFPEWFVNAPSGMRRSLSILIALATVASAVLAGVLPQGTQASEVNVLANGSFEGGFASVPGCGMVGRQWGCFTNGGLANYGFYDDQWDPVVADGEHSQLIEINTKNMVAPDADRYAGIYQTVRVKDWAQYMFSMRGMIRTTNMEGDLWRYRVQVGWTQGHEADWSKVGNWTDVGWDTYYPRTEPGSLSSFQTVLMAEADVITIFVRVWKKWGVPFEELDVNLDSIALVGPTPGQPMHDDKPSHRVMGQDDHRGSGDMEPQQQYQPEQPQQPGRQPMPMPRDGWEPMDGGMACSGPDYISNGGFEHGFNRVYVGDVGKSWGFFTNGGAANYGFYDDQWEPVVAEGKHAQLIEINSKGLYPTDADRYAGIYQQIGGLPTGATYELIVRGLLRGQGNEDDPYRFEAQWGYNLDGDTDWQHVKNWTGMDLGKIWPRTEPGAIGTYTVRFQAPAPHIVIFIRGWKKWAISEVEMDLNLDAISLRGCMGKGGPQEYGGDMGHGDGDTEYGGDREYGGGDMCTYVVKPGDTLGQIASENRVSVDELVRANGIENPNVIYVGQKFQIPGCTKDGPSPKDKDMIGMGGPQMGEPDAMPERPMGGDMPMQPGSDMREGEMREGDMREGDMRDGDTREGDMRGMPSMEAPDMEQRPTDARGMGQEYGMEAGPDMGSGRDRGMERDVSTYTVKKGDTLSAIASQLGTDAYSLAMANGIENMNVIYVGQELSMP